MVNHGTVAIANRGQQIRLTRRIWQLLSSMGVLAAAGVSIFFLFLCALLIRQIPGQIANDPTAARWLLTVSEEYGLFGNVLRALGLFDVLHNPLLQLLLALLALILFIHLANMVALLWRFWHSAQHLAAPVPIAGMPLRLPPTQPLYRLRQAVDQAPSAVCAELTQTLQADFDQVITTTVATAPYQELSTTEALQAQHVAGAETSVTAPDNVEELRLLARRHRHPLIWVRPLLLVGLLLALSVVWISLLVGWEIAPPLLAPGEAYRATTQRVALAYTVAVGDDGFAATLSSEIGDLAQQVPLGERRQLRLGQVAIQTSLGPPAMLLRSTDDTTFSRPGQSQYTTDLGLIFPSLGSEDAVVIGNSVGLRIVRVSALAEAQSKSPLTLASVPQERFLVEVYQGDEVQPVQTIQVSGETRAVIQVGGQPREILLIPLPSMVAIVRYQPGIWLLWLALALILVGAIGFGYRPAFVMVQIAPWPIDRAVVVVQSDVAAEISHIQPLLSPGTP